MIHKKLFFIILFNCLISKIQSQNLKGISFELNTHIGKIIKHTPRLLFPVPPLSKGVEFHTNWQLYGKKEWHQWQHFPIVGASFFYYELGNKNIFGDAYGACPTINIQFLNSKILRGYFQIGSGIAFLTKHYDALNNPLNNAVGSKFNNITHFKLQIEKPFNTYWKIHGGLSFTHFSNGNSQTPNFGVNISALNAGIVFYPQQLDSSNYIPHSLTLKPIKKFGINLHTDLAFIETAIPGGPSYPVYIASIAGVYHFNKVNSLSVGMEYEQNKHIYAFALHSTHAMTRDEAFRQASRYSFFVGDELMFGRFSILIQTNLYVLAKKSLFIPDFWYTKLGMRWYFPFIGNSSTRLYAGIYLKTHRISAEYLAIGGGAAF